MKNIAIFASGSGTNAERICKYFVDSNNVKVRLILSNKATAGVLDRAKKLAVPTCVFSRPEFYEPDPILKRLNNLNIDLRSFFDTLFSITGGKL